MHDEAPIILSLSRCVRCEYDLRGLNRPSRCPECGVELSPGVFDIPVRRLGQGSIPWFAVAQFGLALGLILLFPRQPWPWIVAFVMLVGNIVMHAARRQRMARGLGIPRVVIDDNRVTMLRGVGVRGSWPLRMFTHVDLIRRGRRADLWFHDQLGLAMVVRLSCSHTIAEQVHARTAKFIDNARAWADVGVRA